MAKKVIVIDGYIGSGAYSKQLIRQLLTKDETTVNISSLGGDINHGLDIHDQFAAHGNVIADFTGFSASAATVISLGAKKRIMSENSFYLIHKALNWIDEFGYMNEDDLDQLIEKLTAIKDDSSKITLQIAKMYSKVTGKPTVDILNLMKKETWLNAEEAKQWGFIDEVYSPSEKVNYLEDSIKMAMINAAGYPTPVRQSENPTTPANKIDEEGLFNRLFNRIKDAITPNKIQMKKQFLNLNKALKVEKLETTEEGVFLNEEQLESIDKRLIEAAQAETDRDTARQEMTQTTSALDAIDETVAKAQGSTAKIEAIKALLAKTPGANSATLDTDTDGGSSNSGDDFWTRYHNLKKTK